MFEVTAKTLVVGEVSPSRQRRFGMTSASQHLNIDHHYKFK